MSQGTILFGSNSIYSVEVDERVLQCRLKGKKLALAERAYNPLAPGDRVTFERLGDQGLITAREPRRNEVTRYNPKRSATQTLAANVDLVACVTSAGDPPPSPGFIDRAIVIAIRARLPFALVINKSDLGMPELFARLARVYRHLGHEVLRCSVIDRCGIRSLAESLRGRRTVLLGHSGVGKSSLANALLDESQRVSAISDKHRQGRHTTTASRLLRGNAIELIDTPGLRELDVGEVDVSLVGEAFAEFAPFARRCIHADCRHLDEPACAVRESVAGGAILSSRYASYRALARTLSG